MSNLNVNNIDVQRMINVIHDIEYKMSICSCLTMNTFDKILSKKSYITSEFGEKIMTELENHYDKMTDFKQNHLKYKEEVKEVEKSDIEGEVEDEGPKEISKDKQNLKDIDENTSDITKSLAKSTRNLYRLLKEYPKLVSFIKEHRGDPDLIKFTEDLSSMLNTDIKKSKMTLEEEKSEKDLNMTLKIKISDMLNQINEKKDKLDKLVKERADYKKQCLEDLDNIKKNIETIKDSTDKTLQDKEDDVNSDLRDEEEKHKKKIKEFNEDFLKAKDDFTNLKDSNLADEKKAVELKVESELISLLSQYDDMMKEHKADMKKKKEEDQNLLLEINSLKIKKEKIKEKWLMYENSQKEFKELKRKKALEQMMDSDACETIQNIFRGYATRKQLKKKYKFLSGLKKIKPNMDADKDPKKGKKKK